MLQKPWNYFVLEWLLMSLRQDREGLVAHVRSREFEQKFSELMLLAINMERNASSE